MNAHDVLKQAEATAEDHFKAGRLEEAIAVQTARVKAQPTDLGSRLFLFELLAFAGELDRATRQVDALDYGEMERNAAVATYRRVLDAERARRALFADGQPPQFLSSAPRHVELRLQALGLIRQGQPDEARRVLNEAEAATPAVTGTLNGQPFELLRDCDDVFGPVLEVLSGTGAYFWLPIEQIATLSVAAPKYPRDLLWLPAKLQVAEGPSGDVFLPTLYPATHEQADPQLRLGRLTDWTSSEAGPVRGIGQRTFLLNDEPSHLFDWRELEIG